MYCASEVGVIKRLSAGLTVLLLAGCGGMPLHGSANSSVIPLRWKPTNNFAQAEAIELTGHRNARLRVEVNDDREDPGFIGRNSEKLPPRRVTTPDNVAAFVNVHLKQLMSDAGVIDVENASNVILKAEIQQFFVEETEVYRGDVRLKVTLIDSKGNSIWTGLTIGTSIRSGRSFSAENYYESLSNSLVDAVHNLLDSETFRAALAEAS
jgi:hypothetical protein